MSNPVAFAEACVEAQGDGSAGGVESKERVKSS
jgi:hypothetical protein